MEILTESEKQLVLYSKGHFVKTNLIDDIKKIVAEGFEIPLESTHFYHSYNFVADTFLKLHKANYIDASMHDFFCGLFKWKQILKPEDMIQDMLSNISTIRAAGLNLGKADSKYLTLKQLKE
nr:hypothetical protein [Paenibacillus xylanexedens]